MRWIKWVIVGLLMMIVAGQVVRDYRLSQVIGHANFRFNIAMINPDKGVTFISLDPTEKSILSIPFPTNMAITSRTSGEYAISSLYKLGAYNGRGGMFARQKIQGFMRVPIPGYLVTNSSFKIGLVKAMFGTQETSLSKFDAAILLLRANSYRIREVKESELVRNGVISGNKYYPDRLKEYVGTRLFDWEIGATGVSVAIVNASGENGLGSDMADFLSNLGLDVVMVRSVNGDETLEKSSWQVNDAAVEADLNYVFQNLFGFDAPKVETISDEYRAKVLIRVGKDVKELF